VGRDTCSDVSGYPTLDVWQRNLPKLQYTSTRLTDVGTSRIVRQCSTSQHDAHFGRPQSSQKKKKAYPFGSAAGCVCSDIVLDIDLPTVQAPY